MSLHPVAFEELSPEILKVFSNQYALLTAGDKNSCNTMTISWCQMGTLWGAPMCTVYVRPERYTYQFMEANGYFTVSVLPLEHKKTTLAYCGAKSGRYVDKVKECGLTLCYGQGDAPYFEEAEWVLVCKKVYAQEMAPDFSLDEEAVNSHYKSGCWHKVYIGQVVEVYKK